MRGRIALGLVLALAAGRAEAVTIVKWDCERAVVELPTAVRVMEKEANAAFKLPAGEKRRQAAAGVMLGLFQADNLLESFNWHCGWDEKGRAAYKDMTPRVTAMKAKLDELFPSKPGCKGSLSWPFNMGC